MNRMTRIWIGTAFFIAALHGVVFLTTFKTQNAASGNRSQIFEIVGVRVLESTRAGSVSLPSASFVPIRAQAAPKRVAVKAPLPKTHPAKASVQTPTEKNEGPIKERTQASQAPDLAAGDGDVVAYAAQPLFAPHPAYPPSERRKGTQGRVVLSLLVDNLGQVRQVQVRESSGVEAFDASALKAVKRWKFSPARDKEGNALSRWCTVRILFQVNR